MRELCVLEAERLGFRHSPDVAIKIRNRSQMLLVNESYEQLVAFPLISEFSLSLAKKHLFDELLVYHLLVGFEGCSLPGSFERTKQEAFDLSLGFWVFS